MSLAKIIAIANQKGGVAKTTTCLSLGASLAEAGQSVLLIDLDPQAHLTCSLGLEPEQLHHTVADALLANNSVLSITRETEVPLLDLAPANQGLGIVEKVLYGRANYEGVLKSRLAAMGHDYYDVVVMDCLPSFGALTLNALTAAELLIVPTQCEYYASRALRPVMKLVQLVRHKTNPRLAYRVLITMFDRRNRISHTVRGQLERAFPDGLLETIIEVDTKLKESPVAGQPVNLYAPHTRAAAQYRTLAQELMNHGCRPT
jgi:chromosome partitioning protein